MAKKINAGQSNTETRRLEPLDRRAVKPDKAGAGRELQKAWKSALDVTEHDIASHLPTSHDILVCEATLAGMTSIERMMDYTGLSNNQLRDVLGTPVTMAWISRQVYHHIQHRLGLVDSALFARALRGEIGAIKLLYERLGRLSKDINVQHNYSGSVNIKALSEEDLIHMIEDKRKIIDVTAGSKVIGVEVPGSSGAGTKESGGAPSFLPETEETPQTT